MFNIKTNRTGVTIEPPVATVKIEGIVEAGAEIVGIIKTKIDTKAPVAAKGEIKVDKRIGEIKLGNKDWQISSMKKRLTDRWMISSSFTAEPVRVTTSPGNAQIVSPVDKNVTKELAAQHKRKGKPTMRRRKKSQRLVPVYTAIETLTMGNAV